LRRDERPARLGLLLVITFLGSVSSGVFWSGIFFVTATAYHFSPSRNLVLGALTGVVYALAARLTGPLLRAVERRFSPRTALVGTLVGWALAGLLPLAGGGAEALIWVAALVGGGAASAVTWPIVESYLGAGRHGAEMRAGIGWFNVSWTSATAVPLLVMPLVSGRGPLATLALSALASGVAALAALALPTRPAGHPPELAATAVGAEYPALLRAASWLLPLSYTVAATLSPVLPHRLAAVGLRANESVVAALWMVARFTTLALMWRVGFWHGRWGTLAAAAGALVVGMALVLVGPGLPFVAAGLALFGAGMGLTYYAALYYALTVGHAAVDAGGGFEALVGVGYAVGPLLGLTGHAMAQARQADAVTMVLAAAVVLAASAGALRPYLEVRRRRSS
jgi:hypothetical protein